MVNTLCLHIFIYLFTRHSGHMGLYHGIPEPSSIQYVINIGIAPTPGKLINLIQAVWNNWHLLQLQKIYHCNNYNDTCFLRCDAPLYNVQRSYAMLLCNTSRLVSKPFHKCCCDFALVEFVNINSQSTDYYYQIMKGFYLIECLTMSYITFTCNI